MLMLYSDFLHACVRVACIRVSLVRSFFAFYSGLLKYLFIAVRIILVILKLISARKKTNPTKQGV